MTEDVIKALSLKKIVKKSITPLGLDYHNKDFIVIKTERRVELSYRDQTVQHGCKGSFLLQMQT